MRKVIAAECVRGEHDWLARHGDACRTAIQSAVRPGLPFSAKAVTPAGVRELPTLHGLISARMRLNEDAEGGLTAPARLSPKADQLAWMG